jgi:hypothetical protein
MAYVTLYAYSIYTPLPVNCIAVILFSTKLCSETKEKILSAADPHFIRQLALPKH